MSCDSISRGRLERCKDSVGGIAKVYFVNKGEIESVAYDTTDTDAIDAVVGTPSAYEFEVRGASTYTETITSSRENGTTYFEQALELLSGMTVGHLDEQGNYLEGSFNAAVALRLQHWNDVHKHEKESETESSDS